MKLKNKSESEKSAVLANVRLLGNHSFIFSRSYGFEKILAMPTKPQGDGGYLVQLFIKLSIRTQNLQFCVSHDSNNMATGKRP